MSLISTGRASAKTLSDTLVTPKHTLCSLMWIVRFCKCLIHFLVCGHCPPFFIYYSSRKKAFKWGEWEALVRWVQQLLVESFLFLYFPEVSSSSCPATGRQWSDRPQWLQARRFTGMTHQPVASAVRPSSQMAVGTFVRTARPSSAPAVGDASPWGRTR